jgi:hypothetical protein
VPARAGALAPLVLASVVMLGASSAPGPLPAIVFVSRNPVPGRPGVIPGLGPHHRAVVTGGRLLVREPDGRVRELLPPGTFFDVSDPSVSRDARRIAFAAVQHRDSAWRIWAVGVDGRGLERISDEVHLPDLPAPLASRLGEPSWDLERYDDLDPCWIGDSALVFASTRYPQRAQYADVRVTNLFLASRDPGRGGWRAPVRITSERNGAEEPAMDWARGEIVFARWWFNRYRASNDAAEITTEPERAIARDTVNLWQTMELSPRPRPAHLAAGDLRTRRSSMGYQPAVLANGSIATTYAANLGLSPVPGGTGIQILPPRFGRAQRLAGAIVSGRANDGYGDAGLLAPPSACSPAGLPDGRVLFSYDPGARGDFGLYVARADGSHLERVVDLTGTLELDAAPIVTHRVPPRERPLAGDDLEGPVDAAREGMRATAIPIAAHDAFPAIDQVDGHGTFRFHDLDVFADGPKGSATHGAAPRTGGARIRFFATLARLARPGGDSAVLVREVPVGPGGEVNQPGLPADTPMFEQLVDSTGRVLMTAHGPAHVAGSNAGVAGLTTRCIGCHLGHSTLPVPSSAAPRKGARP